MMLNTTQIRCYRAALCVLLTSLPFSAQAALAALDRTSLLGYNNSANQTHFSHNIQSLERQIIGTQAANKARIQQHIHPTDTDPVVNIKSYVSAQQRAAQLGFGWADTSTWGESHWETFTPDKHQGEGAAVLTPLSTLNWHTLPTDSPVVAQATGWKVCRVPVPQGTFLYGYYDGNQPYCIVGDPSSMQWEATAQHWQHPVTVGQTTFPLPRKQTQFSVLPVADPNTLTERQLLPALVRITQQAHGFAMEHAPDHTETLWSTATMAHQLGRLVNTTGVVDFQLHTAAVINVQPPEHCHFQVQIPQASNKTPLTLTYQTQAQPRQADHYRCQITAQDLQHWLDIQKNTHPSIATTTLGELAFQTVSIPYTYQIKPVAPPIQSAHRQQLQAMQANIGRLQRAAQRVYEQHQDSTLELFTHRLPHLKRLMTEDLANLTLADLASLIQHGFPGEFNRLRQVPHAWRNLLALTATLAIQDATLPTWALADLARTPSFLARVLALLQYNQASQRQERLTQLHTQLNALLTTYGDKNYGQFLQQERYREALSKRQRNLYHDLQDLDRMHTLQNCGTRLIEQLRTHAESNCRNLAARIQPLEQRIAATLQAKLPHTRYLQALHTQHQTTENDQPLRDVAIAALETWILPNQYATIRHQPTWKTDSAIWRHLLQALRRLQQQGELAIHETTSLADIATQLAALQQQATEAQHDRYAGTSTRTVATAPQPLSLLTAEITETYYPISADQAQQPYRRVQSYAHDNLANAAGSLRWALIAHKAEGTEAIVMQTAEDSHNPEFSVQPGQTYRLYLAQDSVEAWASSHLYLAEGQLDTLRADENADDQYYLTFTQNTAPVVLRYQSRTNGGRVYDIALRFITPGHQSAEQTADTQHTTPPLYSGPGPLQAPRVSLTLAEDIPDDAETLALQLSITGQTQPADPYAGVTLRLSDCLERLDQGENACHHTNAFREPPWQRPVAPRLVGRQLAAQHKVKNSGGSLAQPDYNTRTFEVSAPPVDANKPLQTNVRTPLTDKNGDIWGYRQHWYTLHNPQDQYHYRYKQDLRIGIDPLVIRAVKWQMLEASNTPLTTHHTTLAVQTYIDDVLISSPDSLQQAINRYNTQPPATLIQGGGLNHPEYIAEPEDLEDTSPIHQGHAIPSFIYPTHRLPFGTYIFTFTHTHTIPALQSGYRCTRNPANLCVSMISPSFARLRYDQVPQTITATHTTTHTIEIQPPDSNLYPDELPTKTPYSQNPIDIAPGIQWQPITDQVSTQSLPNNFQVHHTEDKYNEYTPVGMTSPAMPPFSPEEQGILAGALEDMGYQQLTHQPKLCPANPTDDQDCEPLPLEDNNRFSEIIGSYDSLQLTLAGLASLTFRKDLTLFAGAALFLATAKNTLKMTGELINNITGNKTIQQGKPIVDSTTYVRMDTESAHLVRNPGAGLVTNRVMLSHNNHLYIDYSQSRNHNLYADYPPLGDSEPLCITYLTDDLYYSAHNMRIRWSDDTEYLLDGTCLSAEQTASLQKQQDLGKTAYLTLDTTAPDGKVHTYTFTLHSLPYTLNQIIAAVTASDDSIQVIAEDYTPEETQYRQFEIALTLPDQLDAAIRETLMFAKEDDILNDGMLLYVQQVKFQTISDSEDPEVTQTAELALDDHMEVARIAIHETDDDLSLPGESGAISLQSHAWEGELQYTIQLYLQGQTITLQPSQKIWLSPYLTPEVLLSWEDYHSQRPLHENTLSVLVRPNMGHTLNLTWMDNQLRSALDHYYLPAIERLYTDLYTAQQARTLVHNTLADSRHDDYTWVRASNYPHLQIYLDADQWHQADDNTRTLSTEQLHWMPADAAIDQTSTVCHKIKDRVICQAREDQAEDSGKAPYPRLYAPTLAEQMDLFIGLTQQDLQTLREHRAAEDAQAHYTPDHPVQIRRASDFTANLQALEHYAFGTFVPQTSWDFLQDDVQIDWENEKDCMQHGHSPEIGKRQHLDTKCSYLLNTIRTFPLKRVNRGPDKGDDEDDRDQNNGDDNNQSNSSFSNLETEKPKKIKLKIHGILELDQEQLKEHIRKTYEKHLSKGDVEKLGLNLDSVKNQLPLAIHQFRVSCDNDPKILYRYKNTYALAIKDQEFIVAMLPNEKDITCEIKLGLTIPYNYLAMSGHHPGLKGGLKNFNLIHGYYISFKSTFSDNSTIKLKFIEKIKQEGKEVQHLFEVAINGNYHNIDKYQLAEMTFQRRRNSDFTNLKYEYGKTKNHDFGAPITEQPSIMRLPVYQHIWREFSIQNRNISMAYIKSEGSSILNIRTYDEELLQEGLSKRFRVFRVSPFILDTKTTESSAVLSSEFIFQIIKMNMSLTREKFWYIYKYDRIKKYMDSFYKVINYRVHYTISDIMQLVYLQETYLSKNYLFDSNQDKNTTLPAEASWHKTDYIKNILPQIFTSFQSKNSQPSNLRSMIKSKKTFQAIIDAMDALIQNLQHKDKLYEQFIGRKIKSEITKRGFDTRAYYYYLLEKLNDSSAKDIDVKVDKKLLADCNQRTLCMHISDISKEKLKTLIQHRTLLINNKAVQLDAERLTIAVFSLGKIEKAIGSKKLIYPTIPLDQDQGLEYNIASVYLHNNRDVLFIGKVMCLLKKDTKVYKRYQTVCGNTDDKVSHILNTHTIRPN